MSRFRVPWETVMTLRSRVAQIAILILSALGIASVAQAQSVTFSDINDMVPDRGWDAATTAPDPGDPNRLVFGFSEGTDQVGVPKALVVPTSTFNARSKIDTMGFVVEAPAGFYIATITYNQTVGGAIARNGLVFGVVNWTAAGVPDAAFHGAVGMLSRTLDFTGENRTRVPVSVTSTIFAAAPGIGFANCKVTAASVQVTLLPLPSAGLGTSATASSQ